MRSRKVFVLAQLTAVTLGFTFCLSADSAPRAKAKPKAEVPSKIYKGTISRQVQAAEKLMTMGKYSEAADLYREALNQNPKDVTARVGYGMACVKQFQIDRAGEEFDKALNLEPKNALAHCGKALCAVYKLQSSSTTIQKNRASYLSLAEKECQTALEIDPQLPEAHFTLGQVYKEQGNLDKASRAFEGATKLEPKYSDAFAGLAIVKLQQNDIEAAEAGFKQAISLNSGNSTAHYGLGQVLLRKGLTDEAISELNTSLYQNRNGAPVHYALGKAYETQGNTVAAVKEYQEAIRIKPESASAYLGIANIREARGDIEHAIADLRSGLELCPSNAELTLRIANDSLRLEKLDDAIKSYENVLAVAPRSATAVDGLTRALYLKTQKDTTSAFVSSNDYEEAERSVARAVKMNPNSLQLRLAQAKLRSLSGKQVDLSTIGVPTTDPERISYAEALLAQNRFDEASAQMNTVIANVSRPKDLFAVGDLALTIKDLTSAEAAYKKAALADSEGGAERAERGLAAVQKVRQSAKQSVTLGEDLVRRKQFASAIDQFRNAIFNNPRQPAARNDLAQALEKLYGNSPKDLQEAIKQYRAYLSLDGELPAKEREKVEKHIAKLDSKAFKLEQKNRIAKK